MKIQMVIWYTSKLERNHNMAGKGDTPRPMDFKKYQENYELIFGKKLDGLSVGQIRNFIGDIILNESSNIQSPTGESEG